MIIGNLNSVGRYTVLAVPVTSYLLDTYTAAAAYSLRQLKTGVTSVVRVRRSGDNAESDFTATEITDGTLTTWTGANNGFVVTWYDQSGNGRDITQSTAGSQPQLVSSGSVLTKGSLAGISFNGSTQYLDRAVFPALQSVSSNTIISVASNEGNTADGNPVLACRNSAGLQPGLIMFTDRRVDSIGYLVDSGATASVYNYLAQQNNADQRLQTYIADASNNGELFLNGTSQETISSMANYGTTVTANFEIGKLTTNTLYHNGYIQEVIVFGTDETSNRTAIENDINENYDLYWNGQNTGLLDTYTAAAAYSLRNLNSSYTGALVRIRRSSDNAERDFYGTWNGNFPTAAVEAFCSATDGFVVTWYDQSGNGNNITQSTAGSQPQIVSSGSVLTKNSLPTVTFDGSDDQIGLLSSVLPSSGALSIFSVAYGNTAASFQYILSTGTSPTTDRLAVVLDRRTSPTRNFFVDTTVTNYYADLSTARNDSDYRLLSGFIDGSNNMSAFDNGSTGGTATYTGTYGNSWFLLGSSNGTRLNGGIAEVICFSTDETSNRTSIESDINTYYSIY